ncbi:hypothetical protein TrST_g9049 [Triparma strigata]|uniref:Uncharacterized protein n=1 Tax=Triparma strigata TaxID=1606541 RepID=A0A9W6ZL15_9STRA|nr:hypothetical protein TrST_g9049 [Triparma strigata]
MPPKRGRKAGVSMYDKKKSSGVAQTSKLASPIRKELEAKASGSYKPSYCEASSSEGEEEYESETSESESESSDDGLAPKKRKAKAKAKKSKKKKKVDDLEKDGDSEFEEGDDAADFKWKARPEKLASWASQKPKKNPKAVLQKRGARSTRASSGQGSKTPSNSRAPSRSSRRTSSSGGKSYKESDDDEDKDEEEESEAEEEEDDDSSEEVVQMFKSGERAPRNTSSGLKKGKNKTTNYNEDSESSSDEIQLESDSEDDAPKRKPKPKKKAPQAKKKTPIDDSKWGKFQDDDDVYMEEVLSDSAEKNQVKPALSAWMYYVKSVSGEVQAQIASSSESTLEAASENVKGKLMAQIGAMWKDLSDEEREPYLEMHKEDRERFDRESAERDAMFERRQEAKRAANFQATSSKRSSKKTNFFEGVGVQEGVDEFLATDSDYDSESVSSQDVLLVEKILANRHETQASWNKIMKDMNTDHISNGSMFLPDPNEPKPEKNAYSEKFLVKWQGYSYMHLSWETQKDLMAECGGGPQGSLGIKSRISTYLKKSEGNGGKLLSHQIRGDGEYIPPDYTQIDRILDIDSENDNHVVETQTDDPDSALPSSCGVPEEIVLDRSSPDYDKTESKGRLILVKWGGIPYMESIAAYERERDLINAGIEYLPQAELFYKRNRKPSKKWFEQKATKSVHAQIDDYLTLKKGHTNSSRKLGEKAKYVMAKGKDKVAEVNEKNYAALKEKLMKKIWKNGGSLRDYQAEGIAWLYTASIPEVPESRDGWDNSRGAMLADEMGLGKTLQTVGFVQALKELRHTTKPTLIVAPLSTIPHWQREFESWTDLNTIVYYGNKWDRENIRKLEFGFDKDRPKSDSAATKLKKYHPSGGFRHTVETEWAPNAVKYDKVVVTRRLWKCDVVITTPETLSSSDDYAELHAINWQCLIVDEAHRLKNTKSKIAEVLASSDFKFDFKVALTGTPIQNNLGELWSLMHFIDKKKFPEREDRRVEQEQLTLDAFEAKFGDLSEGNLLEKLHSVIGTYILRRLKEDVEKSVPAKEETILNCPMPMMQKKQYRAIYEKNIKLLAVDDGRKIKGPSLINVAMELRKCCNHPFLIEGGEAKLKEEWMEGGNDKKDEKGFMSASCGKFKFLDKLLPKLFSDGHRVLMFSQFVMMLDVLEDYLFYHGYDFCRIDGSITGPQRQAAIDRFQGKKSSMATDEQTDKEKLPFIMLLSTRAGGVGINLTAADTCIIYDSDWNPQNDLQAQARCHRIGQTKKVTVYRLVTMNSYEEQMLNVASLKMGLDTAVLSGLKKDGDIISPKEIERLLKIGAMGAFTDKGEEKGEDEETLKFDEMDVDELLAKAKTVVHDGNSGGNKAGGVFSKVTFNAADEKPEDEIDVDDPAFWAKAIGEDKFKALTAEEVLEKRTKNKVAYYTDNAFERHDDLEDYEDDGQSPSDSESMSGDGTEEGDGNEAIEDDSPAFKFYQVDWKISQYQVTRQNQRYLEALLQQMTLHGIFTRSARGWTERDAQGRAVWIPSRWQIHESFSNSVAGRMDVKEERAYCLVIVLRLFWEWTKREAITAREKSLRFKIETWEAKKFSQEYEGEEEGEEEVEVEMRPTEKDLEPLDTIQMREFTLLWKMHKAWFIKALDEVREYEKTEFGHIRKTLILGKAANPALGVLSTDVHKEAIEVFKSSLWDSLKTRMWTWNATIGMSFSPPAKLARRKDEKLPSIRSVLQRVAEDYKELLPVVHAVLDKDKECRRRDEEAMQKIRADAAALPAPSTLSQETPEEVYNIFKGLYSWFVPAHVREDINWLKKIKSSRMKTALSKIHLIELLEVPLREANYDETMMRVPLTTLGLPTPTWGARQDIQLLSLVDKYGSPDTGNTDLDKETYSKMEDHASFLWGQYTPEISTIIPGLPPQQPPQFFESHLHMTYKRASELDLSVLSDGVREKLREAFSNTFGALMVAPALKTEVVDPGESVVMDIEVTEEAKGALAAKPAPAGPQPDASPEITDLSLPPRRALQTRLKALHKNIVRTASLGWESQLKWRAEALPTFRKGDPGTELLFCLLEVATSLDLTEADFSLMECFIRNEIILISNAMINQAHSNTANVGIKLLAIGHLIKEYQIMVTQWTPNLPQIFKTDRDEAINALRRLGSLPEIDRTKELEMKARERERQMKEDMKKVVRQNNKSRTSGEISLQAAITAFLKKSKEKENERASSLAGVPSVLLTRGEVEVLRVLLAKGLPPNVDKIDEKSPYKRIKLDFEQLREACLNAAQVKMLAAETDLNEASNEYNVTKGDADLQRTSRALTSKEEKAFAASVRKAFEEKEKAVRWKSEAKADFEEMHRFLGGRELRPFMVNLLGLVEAIRLGAGFIDLKKKGKPSDNGLGVEVLDEGRRLLEFWAEQAKVIKTPGFGVLGDESRGRMCCELDLKANRAIFAQISQISRLRFFFTSGGGAKGVAEMVPKLVEIRRLINDSWLEPDWWTAQCDLGLMVGLAERGFDYFEEIFENKRYRIKQSYEEWAEKQPKEKEGEGEEEAKEKEKEEGAKKGRPSKQAAKVNNELVQTRASCQIRLNHLVRELNKHHIRKENSEKASTFFNTIRKKQNAGAETQGKEKKRKVDGGTTVAKNLAELKRATSEQPEPAATLKIKTKKGGGGGLKTSIVEDGTPVGGGSILAPSNKDNSENGDEKGFLLVGGGVKRKLSGGGAGGY